VSRLRKDSHGYFVRTNGGVYRPEKSIEDYPLAPGVRTFVTSFKEGEEVEVKNMNRTPFCKVINSKFIEEVWVYHGRGTHLGRNIPTDNSWIPVIKSNNINQ
jgi:hypothetical protein